MSDFSAISGHWIKEYSKIHESGSELKKKTKQNKKRNNKTAFQNFASSTGNGFILFYYFFYFFLFQASNQYLGNNIARMNREYISHDLLSSESLIIFDMILKLVASRNLCNLY